MELSCIVVEDEPLAMERMCSYVSKIPSLNLKGTFSGAIDALAFLLENTVDLIFLDIHLGNLTGIELLESSKIESSVILTTAYADYALRGFELQVADYLLKPFSLARFIQAVERVQKNRGPSVSREFIFIKTEQRLERIPLSELLYIEGMRDYRQLHLESRRLLTPQTFREFEDQFTPHILCRVHKSYMVAIQKIDRIEKDEIQIGSHRIPISETYRKSFFAVVDKQNGNR